MSRDSQGLLPRAAARFADSLAGAFAGMQPSLDEQIEARLLTASSASQRTLLGNVQSAIATYWPDACAAFQRKLRAELAERGGWPVEPDAEAAGPPHTLSLLADAEMEWDLAGSALAKRFDAAGGGTLTEVDGRLARLAPEDRRGNAAVRSLISGEPVARAAQAAIETLCEDVAQRQMLLGLLSTRLVDMVPDAFATVNVFLAEAGIEPEAARPRQAESAGSGRATPTPDEVMGMLARLAGQGLPGGVAGGGVAGGVPGGAPGGVVIPPGMVAIPASLLDSLNQLQTLDRQRVETGQLDTVPAGGNVLREFRSQSTGQQLPPMEAATIDIVAMLFDFILDDPAVPDSVKALIGRLQIPMLKVAMMDKAFFSNREHPARALLDAVSRAAMASGRTLEYGHPLYEKIKTVVNRVLTEFEKDQGIFELLLAEMRASLGEQEEAAARLAEQSQQIAERQEQEDEAAARAEEAYERVVRERAVPELPVAIAAFLGQAWPRVLQRAFLAGGSKGTPWALAVQTLSDLLWTLSPKTDADDRQRMVAMLPELLRRVTAFLDKVGVDAVERSAFLDTLVVAHTQIIKNERRVERRTRDRQKGKGAEVEKGAMPEGGGTAECVSSVALNPSVVVTRLFHQNGIEVARVGLQGGGRRKAVAKPADFSHLARGDWVEFVQDDGAVLRGRLSWVSPQRGIMLFTNPQSAKAISISPEALTHQMRQGLARRVGEEALVDRALGKALNALAPT